jgi:hypothetical protein
MSLRVFSLGNVFMSFLTGNFCAFAVRDLVASVAISGIANARRLARYKPENFGSCNSSKVPVTLVTKSTKSRLYTTLYFLQFRTYELMLQK